MEGGLASGNSTGNPPSLVAALGHDHASLARNFMGELREADVELSRDGQMAMGQNPNRTRSEHPNQ